MNAQFIEFLARHNAIRFGDFTLKSGRLSPYFIDVGALTQGSTTSDLGRYFASRIVEAFGDDFDVVFGPAYKGVPLAVSTTIALSAMGKDKHWLFDRKEVKIHGADANAIFVGGQYLDHGQRVVLVDDVFTTGGTKVEAIERLQKALKAEIKGIVIAVDRLEIGRRRAATIEFAEESGIPVHSITNINDVFAHLRNRPIDGKVHVPEKTYLAYQAYMDKYGRPF